MLQTLRVAATIVWRLLSGRNCGTDTCVSVVWPETQVADFAGKEVDVIDGKNLRRLALAYKVPIITTVAGAKATTSALAGMQRGPLHQVPLQDYFPEAAERSTVEFKIVG